MDKFGAIPDDKVIGHNDKGTISFAATAMKNSRTTQLFINVGIPANFHVVLLSGLFIQLNDNGFLDGMGFSPVAKVVEGMDVVERINSEYGDHPNQGA